MTASQETRIKPQADTRQCGHSQYPLEGATWPSENTRLLCVRCWSQEPLPRADAFSRLYVNSNGKPSRTRLCLSLCLPSSHCNAVPDYLFSCAREMATANATSFMIMRLNLPLKTVLHTEQYSAKHPAKHMLFTVSLSFKSVTTCDVFIRFSVPIGLTLTVSAVLFSKNDRTPPLHAV